jgi:hypothetical protein
MNDEKALDDILVQMHSDRVDRRRSLNSSYTTAVDIRRNSQQSNSEFESATTAWTFAPSTNSTRLLEGSTHHLIGPAAPESLECRERSKTL